MADKKELRALAGEAAAYRQELERADAKWKELNREIKENKNLVGAAKAKIDAQIKSLEKQYNTQKDLKDAIKEAANEQKDYLRQLKIIEKEEAKATAQKLADTEKIAKAQQKAADDLRQRVETLIDDNEEYLDLNTDITKSFGKTTAQAKMLEKALKSTKTISGEFASFVEGSVKYTQEEKEKLVEVAEQYATINKSIIQGAVENKKGIINAKQYSQAVTESAGEWDKVDARIEDILEKYPELKGMMDKMSVSVGQTAQGGKSTAGSAIAKQKSQLASDALGAAFGVTPEMEKGVSGVGDIIEGASLSATGVGAGLGGVMMGYGALKLAGSYSDVMAKLNPRKIIDIERAYDAITKTLENQIDQLKQYAEIQAGIPGLKADLNFRETMAKNTAAFNAASKTAFFGSGLGSPKYAANQLQLAGVGAESIVSAMSEVSKTAGSAMKGLGEDVAVFSKKTGVGTGEIGNILKTIRIFDGTGGSQAFSTMETSLSRAAKDGYNLADITGQLANSAEIAAEFNVNSYKALLKQITATRQLGGDFDKIANAGKSMVLNYKDSIKAEMTLGAILGENVDLSQVRALFAAGRASEAFALLKSSGLAEKAQAAGFFAVEALKQATGGLDITQMTAADYEKGPGVGIQSNASFLKAFMDAQKNLTFENAYIDAGFALLTTQTVEMAQIGAEFYSEFTRGINALLAQQTQQKFIGQVKIGIEKRLNAASFGFRGPSEQGINEFNYKQYGFQPSKNMYNYGRVQQSGYYGADFSADFERQRVYAQSKQNERLINIAKAMDDINRTKGGGDTFEDYVKKYYVSHEERVAANKLLNPGNTIGRGLNQNAINSLSTNGTATTTNGVVITKTAPNDKALQVNQNSYKKLESINTEASATNVLLKNIEILQGMMVKLTKPEFKLVLDGKDITTSITKRVINNTGVNKEPVFTYG